MSDPTFRYRAATADGRLERGRIVAPNRDTAVSHLAARGLHPIEVASDTRSAGGRRTLPVAELALALRLLADLLDAGLPLARALQTLEPLVSTAVAGVLPALLATVREGGSFARGLEKLDVVIPGDVLGVIRAGERASMLAAAVRHAAQLTEDAAATRAAIRGALAYPVILLTAGTASLGLLVGLVLPRFAAILGDLGQSLPPTTSFVLGSAAVLRAGAPATALGCVAGMAMWRGWAATPNGRRQWDALLLRMPLVGEIRAAAATARFAASLSALLATGVPMSGAIRSAAESTGDAEMSARLIAASREVEQGSRLSTALSRHAAVTSLVQRLTRAGEETGGLAPMLAHGSRLERERVLRRMQSAVRLIEPALVVVFGGVVALVAAALLQALYSVRPGP